MFDLRLPGCYICLPLVVIELAICDIAMPKRTPPPPLTVRRILKKLGENVAIARKKRRLSQELIAERVLTTRQTISRIERGDPRVAFGTWATTLFVLGLHDQLEELADPSRDELGMALENQHLPQRVRTARGKVPGAN